MALLGYFNNRAVVKASFLFTVVFYVFIHTQRPDFFRLANKATFAKFVEITSKYVVLSSHSYVNTASGCQAYTMPSEMKDWFGKYDVPLTIHRDYILEPLNLCPSGVVLDFLIAVHTAVEHWADRQDIRQTFGRQGMFANVTSRLVFLLGTSSTNTSMNRLVEAEAELYNDIVIGDFVDSYHNLTLKGAMGIRWVAENCPLTKLVIKLDDDVFLQVFSVIQHTLPAMSTRTRHFSCSHRAKGVKRIMRGGKWMVTNDQFPNMTVYPVDACQGWAVLYTGDMICPLYSAAKVVPFFWIDDVYLYGLLPYTVGDVTYADFAETEDWTCMKEKKTKCKFVAFLNQRKKKPFLKPMWSAMTSNMTFQQRNYFQWQEQI